MKIRTIVAELLRAGPRHNQLLSTLTQYLGICDGAPAGVVTLPYEHATFLLRLGELRYTVSAEDGNGRMPVVRDQTGRELAGVLGAIPGLAGGLKGDRDHPDLLTHLRLVLSASELALLPFEMSKTPTGGGGSPDNWLVLQSQAPVCLTRHVRSVHSQGLRWPKRPRILFLAGPEVPFDEHLGALETALTPWTGGGSATGGWLTVLERATLADVLKACSAAADAGKDFTHVHVLAHGAEIRESGESSFGVELHDQVVSGRALASALTTVGARGVRRPAVMTLATCDSGGVGSVVTSDASVAHDLHEAGIQLVVASQFPFSVRASVPFVETFYREQLWGVHPLQSLYKIRLELFSRFGQEFHDWASLVAYEAFPNDLEEQLRELRYRQVRRAHAAALDRLAERIEGRADKPIPSAEEYRSLVERVVATWRRFPDRGPFATECKGLKASSSKQLAELAYGLAAQEMPQARKDSLLEDCYFRLDESQVGYQRAARDFLVTTGERSVLREASVHWLLGQVVSLGVILGRPLDEAMWMTARLAAETDLEHAEESALGWAHGSLAELWLLRLADPKFKGRRRTKAIDKTLDHAAKIVACCGRDSAEVHSSRRQLRRYVAWWGEPEFARVLEGFGVPSKDSWHGPQSLVSTAERAVEILRGRTLSQHRPATPADAPSPAPEKPPVSETPPAPPARLAKSAPASSASETPAGELVFDVEMLPAKNGDCLWIEYGARDRRRRLLIDCGAHSAAEVVRSKIGELPAAERVFELFILTHIDADHISGVLPLFEDLDPTVRFGDVWFNGWLQLPRDLLGVKQGEQFTDLLKDPQRGLPWNGSRFEKGAPPPPVMVPEGTASLPVVTLRDGLRLTLLSPGHDELAKLARKWQAGLRELKKGELLGRKVRPKPVTDFAGFDVEALARRPFKKDSSAANGSSIAVLAEFGGRSVLLSGDAHAEVVASSVEKLLAERGEPGQRLAIDALKLSHHGSKNGLSKELLDVLDCRHYLVSSDGSRFHHPDREAIARAVVYGGERPTLCFNYRSELNELWASPELQTRYGYDTVYPQAEAGGLRVRL